MSERIKCSIPFCRRTADADETEPYTQIICGKHWRLVPKPLRTLHRRLKRKALKAMEREPAQCTIAEQAFALRLMRMESRLWDRLVAAAAERTLP